MKTVVNPMLPGEAQSPGSIVFAGLPQPAAAGFVTVFLVAAALSAPWPARAADEPDPRALGTAEAMLWYCAKADAQAAEKYRAQVRRMVERASPEAVAHARASGEYHKAQAAVQDFVDKVDAHNVKKLCSETVAVGK